MNPVSCLSIFLLFRIVLFVTMATEGGIVVSAAEDVYYVANSEITGHSLVPKILTGISNFVDWKKNMEIPLSAKNKLTFVLGHHPRSLDPILSARWKTCNDAIMSWILASSNKNFHCHILHSEDVVSAWKTLISRYGGTNAARQFAVERSLRTSR